MIVLNLISGILGIMFMTIAKMITRKKKAELANLVFDNARYLQEESLSIVLSLLSVLIWFLLFSEVASKYPQLVTFVRSSFFVMGALGAWIIQSALSKTQKWIDCHVNEKTNIADSLKDKV